MMVIVHVFLAEKPPPPASSGDPCLPSPCGPNARCRNVGGTPACSCLPNYIGRPPNCRPECTINEECPGNLACQNERCRDPCPGSCGIHASCVVVKHAPMCSCHSGFTGDPFAGCSPVPSKTLLLFRCLAHSFFLSGSASLSGSLYSLRP